MKVLVSVLFILAVLVAMPCGYATAEPDEKISYSISVKVGQKYNIDRVYDDIYQGDLTIDAFDTEQILISKGAVHPLKIELTPQPGKSDSMIQIGLKVWEFKKVDNSGKKEAEYVLVDDEVINVMKGAGSLTDLSPSIYRSIRIRILASN